MHARLRPGARDLAGHEAAALHYAKLEDVEALLDHVQLDEATVLEVRVGDRAGPQLEVKMLFPNYAIRGPIRTWQEVQRSVRES